MITKDQFTVLPESNPGRVRIEIIHGAEGPCIAINDTRVAGPKPWGGGTVIRRWDTTREQILASLPKEPHEAKLESERDELQARVKELTGALSGLAACISETRGADATAAMIEAERVLQEARSERKPSALDNAVKHVPKLGREGISCSVCGLPYEAHPRCKKCGYTYCDCLLQGDHRLCGEPDPAKPKPDPASV
jgi:hypothetical protein